MPREPGDKIIPKLIPVIRDTIVDTKRKLASHEVKVRSDAVQVVVDRMGHEFADMLAPIFNDLIERGEMPPVLHEMVKQAASGEHQWQSTALAQLGLAGTTGALGTVLSNFLYPITRQLIEFSPHLVPNPNDLAVLVARGFDPPDDGATEAAGQGISNGWFNRMIAAAQSYPAPSDIQELYRRQLISEQQALNYLLHNGFNGIDAVRMLDLHTNVIPVADAALAVLRGNISLENGVAIAAENGFNETQFNVLIGNTGEPPGVIDMLTMFRRGIISEEQLVRGIRESRLRNEWIPAILAYRFTPMTTADAIDAYVQNHIDLARVQAIANENGLRPEDLNPLIETAGEPLSKTELLTLLKRGQVSADFVRQGLRESRLKDKYIEDALLLARAIPPLFTIRQLISSNSISDSVAAHLLTEDGYEPSLITAIIHSAHKVKTAKVRTVTEGMLSELYQEQAIDGDTFTAQLETMGYTAAEAAQIKEVDDWRIAKTNRDAAISHLRTQYVGHKVDSAFAQGELDALLVPSNMRDKLLADWNLEIAASVRILSEAQIVDAWDFGIFAYVDAIIRLVQLGYTQEDAGTLIAVKNKGPVTDPPPRGPG